jgi:general secretion pathway protein D
MNKYRVYPCFVFILATLVCSTETGSRKRYRNKKQPVETTVNTHINVNAYQPLQNTQLSALKNNLTSAPATAPIKTANIPAVAPQQYDNPFVAPKVEMPKIEVPAIEEEDEDSIELNFENADLQNFVKQIEDIFEVTFLSDDALQPVPQGKKVIKNNKISFKSNIPLSKKEAWNLFVTFLDIAGFAIIPQANPKIYRITTIDNARRSALPTFIGVDYSTLPDTDELIRYVYFLENAPVATIIEIINPLRSTSSQGLIALQEHKGFILTDKSYNIKKLMSIVKELDKVSIPESMSVLKLRNADADKVANLYRELLPKEDTSSRFFTKKQPTSLYFPENTRIISDPRTNTLILLGPKNAIQKIETFIVKYIDVELDQAYSPLYTYQLKYAEAKTIADIMTSVVQESIEPGKHGGVRGVDQYMRPMTFIPEPETNRLIIKGYYEDYLKVKKVIKKLDQNQPQAAIEVLIVSLDITDQKSLGAQIRSKQPGPNGLLGNNVKFQTSGLYGSSTIVTNPDPSSTGTNKLLGNLINLVTGAVPGTSILSLGADAFGVWGIFQALQKVTDVEVVSNPFILASNNTKATVSIGQERRIVTAQVVGTSNQNAFDADQANLAVNITPQINSDGMIGLAIRIEINEFTDATDQTSGTQTKRMIDTNAIVANKEVLALGGLIRDNISDAETKVPILGDIPILGWFFKNKQKVVTTTSLLVLISTRIIEPHTEKEMEKFSNEHVAGYQQTIEDTDDLYANRDPIYRMFFADKVNRAQTSAEGLIFTRHEKEKEQEVFAQQEEAQLKREQLENEQANKKKKNSSKEPDVPQTSSQENYEETAHNTLIKAIQSKQRTQLSLANFLKHKEVRS